MLALLCLMMLVGLTILVVVAVMAMRLRQRPPAAAPVLTAQEKPETAGATVVPLHRRPMASRALHPWARRPRYRHVLAWGAERDPELGALIEDIQFGRDRVCCYELPGEEERWALAALLDRPLARSLVFEAGGADEELAPLTELPAVEGGSLRGAGSDIESAAAAALEAGLRGLLEQPRVRFSAEGRIAVLSVSGARPDFLGLARPLHAAARALAR